MAGASKRKIQWAISLLLMMLYFSVLPAQAQYGGGSGDPNDPYLIYTAEQMNAIGANQSDWDKHFKLTTDIDLSAYRDTDYCLRSLCGRSEISYKFSVKIRRKKNEKSNVCIRSRICILHDGYGF
jgi:hypothetical protein